MPVQPEIQPLSRAKRKIIVDLATRHGRERRGLFRLEGPRAIEDAIARGARFRCLVVNEDGEPWVERWAEAGLVGDDVEVYRAPGAELDALADTADRKSTRLNSSHGYISYAVFCLKKKKNMIT